MVDIHEQTGYVFVKCFLKVINFIKCLFQIFLYNQVKLFLSSVV